MFYINIILFKKIRKKTSEPNRKKVSPECFYYKLVGIKTLDSVFTFFPSANAKQMKDESPK